MNIDVNSKITTNAVTTTTTAKPQTEESVTFSEELSTLSTKEITQEEPEDENQKVTADSVVKQEELKNEEPEKEKAEEDEKNINFKKEENIKPQNEKEQLPDGNVPKDNTDKLNIVIDGLEDVVAQINNKLNQQPNDKPEENNEKNNLDHYNEYNKQDEKDIFELNTSDNIKEKVEIINITDKNTTEPKPFEDNLSDISELTSEPHSNKINDIKKKNEKEGNTLINNEMNIPEPNETLKFQMNASMNFSNEDKPFANFINQKDGKKLNSSTKDLAEEEAILSTMNENIAMANKNQILAEKELQSDSKVKTVVNSQGIKKVDKRTNVTVDTIVKYDTVVMNKDDVDFFAKLVENGQAEMPQATQKSSHISKTLADMLAKSMKDNQPVRIDFDNNISVIIKISRDGKISADFLPSSQIAEAYLKENLPLLKQKFDDNNIEYDELNHREQKQNEKENRKKGQKDE